MLKGVKLNPSKLIFIGLPGSGKSSAAALLAKKHNLMLCAVDDKVKETLNAYTAKAIGEVSPYSAELDLLQESFIVQGCKSELVRKAFKREGFEKHSIAFMTLLSEPYWRQVEATIAACLIRAHPECLFDLGGSQVFNSGVQKAAKDMEFHFVYLDADEETVLRNICTLQPNGKPRWQFISNYQKAGDGWQVLAQDHRRDRVTRYEAIADETVTVDKTLTVDEIVDDAERLVCGGSSLRI